MEPASLIATVLALGAAARRTHPTAQIIAEAYDDLKSLIRDKYPTVSIGQLEEAPESQATRAGVENELTQAGVDKDEEVKWRAKILVDVIQVHAPETDRDIGVDLPEIKDAVKPIDDIIIISQGDGIIVKAPMLGIKLRGDITASIEDGFLKVSCHTEEREQQEDNYLTGKLQGASRQERHSDSIYYAIPMQDAVGAAQVKPHYEHRVLSVDVLPLSGLTLFELSLLHPRKLVKGRSSLFMVLIYTPDKSQEASEWIAHKSPTDEVQDWDAELPTNHAVSIQLSSGLTVFSVEVPIILRPSELKRIPLHGTPNETAATGRHDATLSIFDSQKKEQYGSWPFQIIIVNPPKTWFAWVASIFSGVGAVVGSVVAIITSSFGIVSDMDTARGVPPGTTFGAIAGVSTTIVGLIARAYSRYSGSPFELQSSPVEGQFSVGSR